MATIGTSVTLMDFARRLDPNDKIARIIETLAAQNEILMDMPFMEGNLQTGHKTTVRTGLPTPTWRLLNYGVQPTKSTTKQVTDTCGLLESRAEVDKELADLNGNAAEFRLSEDAAFIEAMNQEIASTIFYGNTATNPEKFVGLAPRYNTPSTDSTQAGYNILDGGGTGSDNTSIWLIHWGDQTVHGIYPKGTRAGLEHQDLGEIDLFDGNTPQGRYRGYSSIYKWRCGLTVRDWRYAVRIANIDVSNLVSGTGAADIINLMIKALERPFNMAMGTPVFYMNKVVRTHLRLQMLAKPNAHIMLKELAGKLQMMFDEVPIRRCDALLNTESAVTGTFATI